MEPKIFRSAMSTRKPDDIQASAGNESPGLAEKSEYRSAFVVKPVGLARIVLQLSSKETISRRGGSCGDRKPADEEPVTS
jgi:hypothetical protein